MKNKNIGALIIIIVLLLISLSGTIYGTYIKYFTEGSKEEENKNHEFKYNNSLYFYDNNILLGKYKCENTYCDYPSNTVEEYDRLINGYMDTSSISLNSLVNGNYVFLRDNTNEIDKNTILYDLKRSSKIVIYNNIKLYNNKISDNRYIINLNNKYGVLKLGTLPYILVEPKYDYVGVKPNILNENNEILANEFIVKKDNKFYLINKYKDNLPEKELTSKYDNLIVNYNNKYVILKNNELYEIYDYEGNRLLNNYNLNTVYFIDKYVEILANNNLYFIYDLDNNKVMSKINNVANISDYSAVKENNEIVITINNEIVERINISE